MGADLTRIVDLMAPNETKKKGSFKKPNRVQCPYTVPISGEPAHSGAAMLRNTGPQSLLIQLYGPKQMLIPHNPGHCRSVLPLLEDES